MGDPTLPAWPTGCRSRSASSTAPAAPVAVPQATPDETVSSNSNRRARPRPQAWSPSWSARWAARAALAMANERLEPRLQRAGWRSLARVAGPAHGETGLAERRRSRRDLHDGARPRRCRCTSHAPSSQAIPKAAGAINRARDTAPRPRRRRAGPRHPSAVLTDRGLGAAMAGLKSHFRCPCRCCRRRWRGFQQRERPHLLRRRRIPGEHGQARGRVASTRARGDRTASHSWRSTDERRRCVVQHGQRARGPHGPRAWMAVSRS